MNDYEKDDPDLTPQAKQRIAQEAFEKHKGGVQQKNQAAREALIKTAKSIEKNAVPTPKGVSLTTEDPTRLLLIQGEADRVRRIAEKRSSHPVGGGRVGDYLRGEYKRGVEELSGAEAQAVCAGTLRVAAELGVSEEEIVGPLRTDQQRQRLDDARRLYYFSDIFSKDAPAPPKALARAARRDVGMQRPVFMPRTQAAEPVQKAEPSHGARKTKKKVWK